MDPEPVLGLPACPGALEAHCYADAVFGPGANDFTSFLPTLAQLANWKRATNERSQFGSRERRFSAGPVAVYRELCACLHAALDLAPVNSPRPLANFPTSPNAAATAELLSLGRSSGLGERGTIAPKFLAAAALAAARDA